MSEWINVKDQLPICQGKIITSLADGTIGVAESVIIISEKNGIKAFEFERGMSFIKNPFTRTLLEESTDYIIAWQPAPEAYKLESDGEGGENG